MTPASRLEDGSAGGGFCPSARPRKILGAYPEVNSVMGQDELGSRRTTEH